MNTSSRVEYLLEAVVFLLKMQIASKGVSHEYISSATDVPQVVHLQVKKPKTLEQLAEEEAQNAKKAWGGLMTLAKAGGVKVKHYRSIAERDAAEKAEQEKMKLKQQGIRQWPPMK